MQLMYLHYRLPSSVKKGHTAPVDSTYLPHIHKWGFEEGVFEKNNLPTSRTRRRQTITQQQTVFRRCSGFI